MLKAALHVHVKGDPGDYIRYDGFEFLDRAYELGFEIVSFTCHQKVVYNRTLRDYAKKLDILLIPGIELNLGGHVLVLNADREAESLKTLSDLRDYRNKRPEIFTIAAHPFFPSPPRNKICFKEKIYDHIQLFDGIELSWFYSRLIDWNQKAEELADGYDLPYIATSDIHIPDQMHNGHVLIDSEKNVESVIEALHQKRFNSIAQPQGVFQMWWTFAKMQWALHQKYLPWTPPHTPFQHEDIPANHQGQSTKRSQADRVS